MVGSSIPPSTLVVASPESGSLLRQEKGAALWGWLTTTRSLFRVPPMVVDRVEFDEITFPPSTSSDGTSQTEPYWIELGAMLAPGGQAGFEL